MRCRPILLGRPGGGLHPCSFGDGLCRQASSGRDRQTVARRERRLGVDSAPLHVRRPANDGVMAGDVRDRIRVRDGQPARLGRRRALCRDGVRVNRRRPFCGTIRAEAGFRVLLLEDDLATRYGPDPRLLIARCATCCWPRLRCRPGSWWRGFATRSHTTIQTAGSSIFALVEGACRRRSCTRDRLRSSIEASAAAGILTWIRARERRRDPSRSSR